MDTSTSTDIFEVFDLHISEFGDFWLGDFKAGLGDICLVATYEGGGLWIASECIMLHEEGKNE